MTTRCKKCERKLGIAPLKPYAFELIEKDGNAETYCAEHSVEEILTRNASRQSK